MLKHLVEILVRWLEKYLTEKKEEDNNMYVPLTPDSIEELKKQLEPTMTEKFLKVCLDNLDKDVSEKYFGRDTVSDEIACAETVSILIQQIFPDFKIWTSTKDLDAKLFLDKRFQRITEPKIGSIIISPRTPTTVGHCGVFITNERVASNTSFGVNRGKFIGNYDWNSWVKEMKDRRGLRIYLYQLVDL